jgi:LysR family transcriptional regulator, transcriptional activator of the cysJI operon
MTLRHLAIFIKVFDLGSMTAAAQALFISQPTVSQAISELESYYGIKLFDRLAKRLFITEKGLQLLSYARHITELVNEMEQSMKNPDQHGVIRIGSSLTIANYLLPDLVSSFSEQYPRIQVQAITKNTKEIEALVLQNAVDFAIVEGLVHSPDLIERVFMEDQLILVCGRTHFLYKTKSISPLALQGLSFIVRETGSGTRELFENMMTAHELTWKAAWECNGSDILKNAAMKGLGIGVISQRLVENELKAGTLTRINIDGVDLKRKFSVIYHKNKYLSGTMKAFITLCCNAV